MLRSDWLRSVLSFDWLIVADLHVQAVPQAADRDRRGRAHHLQEPEGSVHSVHRGEPLSSVDTIQTPILSSHVKSNVKVVLCICASMGDLTSPLVNFSHKSQMVT